ncbi:ER membrane protein, putative [Actinidia rufa]|uniref:ER membrane protein, putative n=1 Tax=Actinidia rufa TaxID=165716 RepID=A0A7J0GMS1_9ERIC|nr:ER membrane protein, putative [Actinidia rufa]
MGKIGLFDLERHFAFYGAYHRNPVNILIHMLFVWPIFFTTAVLLYFHSSFLRLLISLQYWAGSLAAMLCLACWVSGSLLAKHLGFSLAWKVVLAAQLFCWTGQFIGHGVFEKRAPALLDNLAQAFLMAPFFVLLEALQSFFGYEPYPGFHASVKAKVDAEIKEWKDTKGKKTS